MIGVIVIRAMCDDEVSVPFPNQSRDLLAVLKRRQEFTVVDVKDFSRRADSSCCFLHFRSTSFRKRTACHPPMTDVTVGDRNKFDMMALLSPFNGRPCHLELAIIGVSSKGDDPKLAVIFGLARGRQH